MLTEIELTWVVSGYEKELRMISTYTLVTVIGIIYPAFIALTHKKTNQRIKADGKYRLVDYRQLIIIFWVLTIFIIANLFLDDKLKLNFFPTINTIGIIIFALTLVVVGLLIVQSRLTIENPNDVKDQMIDGYHYLPKTKQELNWFYSLSLSAGICEEIIFRWFVFSFLLNETNLLSAFILTNIIFAVTHMGTGKRNILTTFILGLLFTTIYYFTNNIWLPIILHCAIDLYTGKIGYKTEKALKDLREKSENVVTAEMG